MRSPSQTTLDRTKLLVSIRRYLNFLLLFPLKSWFSFESSRAHFGAASKASVFGQMSDANTRRQSMTEPPTQPLLHRSSSPVWWGTGVMVEAWLVSTTAEFAAEELASRTSYGPQDKEVHRCQRARWRWSEHPWCKISVFFESGAEPKKIEKEMSVGCFQNSNS